MKLVARAVLVLALLYVAAWGYRIWNRKYYLWMPGYLRQTLSAPEKPTGPVHLLFYYTDHFEPGDHRDLMDRWESDYPKLAARHRDATGRPLQHTWFYPGEQPIDYNTNVLRRLVDRGLGEVELHYHHHNDTSASARRKFADAIIYFQRFGFLKTVKGETRFAFIHGNWSLDNSDGPAMCGVNDELRILRELGCFADFTFPSLWTRAQPAMVNTIYQATDNPGPKSYDRGVPWRVGKPPAGDLALFEGPLAMAPLPDPRKLFFVVEDGDIHPAVPVTPRRVDLWIRANVHVEGRPNWVFLKVHGHAASTPADIEETLGGQLDSALAYLENRYNDGARYVLHYITARQAYNIARAAVDGKDGDPAAYLDYDVAPYLHR